MNLLTLNKSTGNRNTIVGSSRLLAPWRALAERVRTERPDVVILIARKMPRLAELFGLTFGDSLVISDMAIPFCHALIRGRRVAIVDDLVNVGSTLAHARDCVWACGARDVKFFALGKRAGTSVTYEVTCVFSDLLDDVQYRALVYEVPVHLRHLNKPYDLEFPIIPCRLLPPLRDADELLALLRSTFGFAAVHDMTPRPSSPPFRRLTVDLEDSDCGNYKLRLYVDEALSRCNLVPFAIPSRPGGEYFPRRTISRSLFNALVRPLADVPQGASLWPEESHQRIALYVRSLDLGLDALDSMSTALCLSDAPLDQSSASLLFGPSANVIASDDAGEAKSRSTRSQPTSKTCSAESPFWDFMCKPEQTHLWTLLQDKVKKWRDPVRVIASLFDVLAEMTGAYDAGKYSLDWPYSSEEVRAKPYLRLRIGPTFADLIRICQRLGLSESLASTKHLASVALDFLIDDGAVVPTIARYDNMLYRIYRKGETPPRDAAVNRLCFAATAYGKPLSLTTLAKIDGILSFSNRIEDVTTPYALARGNAASVPSGVLDLGSSDVATYARDIGRLRLVESI